jgi:hypothetical protein
VSFVPIVHPAMSSGVTLGSSLVTDSRVTPSGPDRRSSEIARTVTGHTDVPAFALKTSEIEVVRPSALADLLFAVVVPLSSSTTSA